ncbi:MAG: DNA-binding protein WhiA [Ruminococcaceae bacterium]|nr:DNA-binding protein WhiA [Oscillospiraceae bacterium]
MSFSSDTKTELCRSHVSNKCCAIAECYGILLYGNTFTNTGIKIITESYSFAKRLSKLFKVAFGFSIDKYAETTAGGKHIFTLTDKDKLNIIFDTYGYDKDKALAHHINFGVLEDPCCHESFMRGVFLAGGSVTDPEKRYHLELVTDHYSVSREGCTILLEMGFNPKVTDRNGNYIIYFKQSDVITDFLTTIGAPLAAMEIMNAKITKNVYNTVNRKINCDTANVEKTVEASHLQLEAIRRLNARGKLDELPEKLRETAQLRMDNPELSLSQLAELTSPPVTKSCLNHRLRKIMELSANLG